MELKDTVEMMNSGDYKERFKAEYYQTKIRYEKLKAFNNRIEAHRVSQYCEVQVEEPKHDCSLELLKQQQRQMGEYLHTLEIRAVIEDIDVEMTIQEILNNYEVQENEVR